MYISSAALHASMRSSILSSQQQLADAQKEISSGTYADLGLTLGSTSGQLLGLTAQANRLSAYTTGNNLAATRLTSTATVLTSLQSTADTFMKMLTTDSTGGGSSTGLPGSAADNLRALVAGLNTTVDDQAIFGGLNTETSPIAAYGATSASKTAVDNAFQSTFGFSQTDPAASSITVDQMSSFLTTTFANLYSPASYAANWSTATDATQSTEVTPGQTVTSSVSANESAMRQLAEAYTMVSEFTGAQSPLSAATQQAVMKTAIAVTSLGMSGLTDVQATVGGQQNVIKSATTLISAQSTMLAERTSELHDSDAYALNTKISSLQTQIQASFELTAALKKLSLTDYFSA